jgi:two-component system chemotaxis sensor kinase CheA
MEWCLTGLEGRPQDRGLVDEIFRAVHTIKGSAGFLGFARLETLSHAGESLLSSLRTCELVVTPELISGLLELLDSLRAILQIVEQTGGEGHRRTDEDSATVSRLMELNDAGRVSAAPAPAVSVCDMPAGASQTSVEASTGQVFAEAPEGKERRVFTQPVDRTVRVDVLVLDRLMDQVGELVLTRNQLMRVQPDQQVDDIARRLNAVTSNLRETVMRARLQPIGHLFGKFPRLVRDLARACGKQVRLEVEGQDTRLDKNLLEAIRDPLTHALRNAIDHGIEKPNDRLRAGKNAEGVIHLRAFQENGSVIIELKDDGAGILGGKVAAKAVECGLITAGQASALSDREKTELIFLPGLSTAAEVTNLSGRGVGMDVVRANVQRAGGSVQLNTTAGEGATVRLTLPLTVAIMPALVAQIAGQSLALAQSAVLELIYISPGELSSRLERKSGVELLMTRGERIEVLRLAPLLGLAEESPRHSGHHVALLESEGYRFGALVNEVIAPEEIVTKPISSILRRSGFFSGAALLGSGELALVLDIGRLRCLTAFAPAPACGRTGRNAESIPPTSVSLPVPHSTVIHPPRSTQPIVEVA